MGTRNNGEFLGQTAWVLATAEDVAVRDVPRALDYARKACERTSWSHPGILDTLACAHAASGQFDEALHWVEKALAGYDTLPPALQQEIREHEHLFRQGRAVVAR